MLKKHNGINIFGCNNIAQKKTFRFGNYVLWFPKEAKEKVGKFTRHWYGTYHIQYYLFNNIVLLITLGNVEPHPILVNVNKLKPCMYVE